MQRESADQILAEMRPYLQHKARCKRRKCVCGHGYGSHGYTDAAPQCFARECYCWLFRRAACDCGLDAVLAMCQGLAGDKPASEPDKGSGPPNSGERPDPDSQLTAALNGPLELPAKVTCPWCQQAVKTHACTKYHTLPNGDWCPGGGASPGERELKSRDLIPAGSSKQEQG